MRWIITETLNGPYTSSQISFRGPTEKKTGAVRQVGKHGPIATIDALAANTTTTPRGEQSKGCSEAKVSPTSERGESAPPDRLPSTQRRTPETLNRLLEIAAAD